MLQVVAVSTSASAMLDLAMRPVGTSTIRSMPGMRKCSFQTGHFPLQIPESYQNIEKGYGRALVVLLSGSLHVSAACWA